MRKHRYICTLSGGELDDVLLPLSRCSIYLKLQGDEERKSNLSATVPGIDYAYQLGERDGENIRIDWYYTDSDGVENVVVLCLMPTTEMLLNEGATNRSFEIKAEKKMTWADPEAITLRNVTYRSPNRTDGKWTYYLSEPIEGLEPGSYAEYEGHTLNIEEIQYHISPTSCQVYLTASDTFAAGCVSEDITVPDVIEDEFDSDCYLDVVATYISVIPPDDELDLWEKFYTFTIEDETGLRFQLDSSLDAYVEVREGAQRYGDIVIGPGVDIQDTFDAGEYTIRVWTSDSGTWSDPVFELTITEI